MGAWAMVLAGGILTDHFGIRKVMSLGLMVTGCLLLSMSLVDSFPQAMAIMFACGMARGTVFPSSTKAVLEWFPRTARATAMGIKQLGLPIAGIATASMLPAIGLAIGWRSAMAAPGLFIVASGIIVATLYREAQDLEHVPSRSVGIRTALEGLIRNRSLLALCFVAFCYSITQLALLSYLPLYFSETVLVPAIPDGAARIVAAGGYLAACQAGGAVGRVSWGAVSDRLFHGRRVVALAIIGVLSALMSILVGNLGRGLSPVLLAGMVFVYGGAVLGWPGVYNALVTEIVGRTHAATGVGLCLTLTELGTVVGPPLFGFIVDVADSYQIAWFILGCVSAAGGLAAMMVARLGTWTRQYDT